MNPTKLAILTLLCSVSIVYAAQEFAVYTGPGDQLLPDIHNGLAVWADNRQGDFDIYAADISNPADITDFVVSAYTTDQNSPAVYDNTIVWQEYINGNWDIYGAQIETDGSITEFSLWPTIYDEKFPQIAGETVIWQENILGHWDITAADISNISEPNAIGIFFPVEYDKDQTNAAIYKNTIVYQDDTYSDSDLYSVDIWRQNSPEDSAIDTTENADQQNPAIWQNKIVYEDNALGSTDILLTYKPAVQNINFEWVVQHPAEQTNPAIDNNIVVWQDNRNGSWDIYAKNLLTDSEYIICEEPGDQQNPSIHNDLIVWQDNRNGNWDIYAVKLSQEQAPVCTQIKAADVNMDCKVNLEDFAQIAQQWLNCYLEPASLCL